MSHELSVHGRGKEALICMAAALGHVPSSDDMPPCERAKGRWPKIEHAKESARLLPWWQSETPGTNGELQALISEKKKKKKKSMGSLRRRRSPSARASPVHAYRRAVCFWLLAAGCFSCPGLLSLILDQQRME